MTAINIRSGTVRFETDGLPSLTDVTELSDIAQQAGVPQHATIDDIRMEIVYSSDNLPTAKLTLHWRL